MDDESPRGRTRRVPHADNCYRGASRRRHWRHSVGQWLAPGITYIAVYIVRVVEEFSGGAAHDRDHRDGIKDVELLGR